MKGISWNIVSLLILTTSQLVLSAPNARVKREDEGIAAVADDSHLSPITSEVSQQIYLYYFNAFELIRLAIS